MLHRRPLLAVFSAALALPAAAQQPLQQEAARAGDLAVRQPWTRASGQGATAAGFMAISNGGAAADRLLSASSPAARAMELHSMERDGEVMRMRPVQAIEIGAGQTVTLRPGGLHLMMIGLSQPLRVGETVPVTLRFERAGEVQVALPVQAAGAREPAPHRH
jgi:periplasmic copper chaperone A